MEQIMSCATTVDEYRAVGREAERRAERSGAPVMVTDEEGAALGAYVYTSEGGWAWTPRPADSTPWHRDCESLCRLLSGER